MPLSELKELDGNQINSFPGVRLKDLAILQREAQWVCVREREKCAK